MSQKVIGLRETNQQLHERLFLLEQLLGKSPNSKLERIDQFEKEQNALKNQMNHFKHAQEEAKLPQPQEFEQFVDEVKEKLKLDKDY